MVYRRIMNQVNYKYVQLTSGISFTKIKSYTKNRLYKKNIYSAANIFDVLYKIVFVLVLIILGFSIYYRTTNMWALKNLGDSFIHKSIGRRPIIVGAFHRLPEEQNVDGAYAVIQFIGDVLKTHELYCISESKNKKIIVTTALVQRIHEGKRGTNDVCSWSGHLAECEIADSNLIHIKLTSNRNWNSETKNDETLQIELEKPVIFGKKKLDLVICVAPLYVYTEWQILITGIETWLALGASKIIFPIQSTSNDTWDILSEYEKQGLVLKRYWPKWPILSDINPNGLVLSRGIEESHVNCLFYAKPFADMIVFTDIDDMLLPVNPQKLHPTVNVEILKNLFQEHPNAGSFLFEHRDVQFVLPPETKDHSKNNFKNFNFNFMLSSHWKMNCKVWRMKTRVAVNASRVDTINMHETGINRFGYVQVRIPCHKAHFYHLRHSYKNIALNEWPIEMKELSNLLNMQWQNRLSQSFSEKINNQILEKSSTESFEDFDRCVMAITNEHFTLKVSRCMTPYVCYSKHLRKMACVASKSDYAFKHTTGDFLIIQKNFSFTNSDSNCEAPLPKYIDGNYFYLP